MYLHTKITPFNADLYTPVELYLSLRNNYRKTCLLEANDYHSRQDSKSIIGFEPIIELQLSDNDLTVRTAQGRETTQLNSLTSVTHQIQEILNGFEFEQNDFNGFFGRLSFEFNLRDETHIQTVASDQDIPQLHLFVFKYIIVIDHFTNEGSLIENSIEASFDSKSINELVRRDSLIELPFELRGE